MQDTLRNFYLFTKTSFLLPFCAKHVQVRFSDHSNYGSFNMLALTGQLFKTAHFAVVNTSFLINLNINLLTLFFSFYLNTLGYVPAKFNFYGLCDILFIVFIQYFINPMLWRISDLRFRSPRRACE